MVSALIITYNHEQYIAQAIESVLMQQCDSPIEVVIGIDYCSDRTEQICHDYAERYPAIKLLTTDCRIGMMNNFLRTVNACSGKYIAMLEGDDYWTANDKIQTQINFLERNPKFILCFHNRNQIQNDIISDKTLCDYGQEKHFTGAEVLFIKIHTLTVVFRNILKEHPYPEEFCQLPLYDFALWAYLSLFGKFAYLDFNGATYRLHANGYYSADETVSGYRKWLYCQRVIRRYFPENYQAAYNDFVLMLNFMITEELRSRNNNKRFYLDLLELVVRSIKYGDHQYTKFYYSHYKTVTKKMISKLFLSSPY